MQSLAFTTGVTFCVWVCNFSKLYQVRTVVLIATLHLASYGLVFEPWTLCRKQQSEPTSFLLTDRCEPVVGDFRQQRRRRTRRRSRVQRRDVAPVEVVRQGIAQDSLRSPGRQQPRPRAQQQG